MTAFLISDDIGIFTENLGIIGGVPVSNTLIQVTRFDNSGTFYTHIVARDDGDQTLTQSARYDNSSTFYTHIISTTAFEQTLTQSVKYDNSSAFYTHKMTGGTTPESGWLIFTASANSQYIAAL